MDRTEYLKAARDNASDTASAIHEEELLLPASQIGPLFVKRTELEEAAAAYQAELIVIEAKHVTVGRPDQADKDRMAALRNRVRDATQGNLAASALITLAGDVLDVIEKIRAV